ncbi:MAG: putative iron-regulated rane protein [Fibrobacteres bacterium]|nr:putative iron-regulated rane protein [Fibrobacterota bacterium]
MHSRKFLFPAHLAAGLIAGTVLFSMACSGLLLAFAPQITAIAERGVSRVAAPPGATPLPPGELLAKVRQAFPGSRIESMAFESDPSAAILAGSVYLDPYSGTVSGKASPLRGYFRSVEHWHRWMGEGKRGKALTDASALVVLFLVLSGLRLWLPRAFTRAAFRRALIPDPALPSRAGQRNLHMTLGAWSGGLLLVSGFTGAVMAYPWAESLLFSLMGSQAPPARKASDGERPGAGAATAPDPDPAAWDSLRMRAADQVPVWRSLVVRLPGKTGAPLMATFESPGFAGFSRRSRLTLDARTGSLLKWEPFEGMSAGRKARSWTAALHTGRGFGPLGQIAAALAAFTLAMLAWTGMSLGLRRVYDRIRSRVRRSSRPPPLGAPGTGNRRTSPRHTGAR